MAIFSPFLECALQYAGRGWRVFPCRPKTKLPLTTHGFKEATVKPSLIERWWERWPDANVGVATGSMSGLLVVDVDGLDALARLQELSSAASEPLGATAVCVTSRGWHLYYMLEPGEIIKSSVGKDSRAGIDFRAEGGYVLAPPSVHPSGWVYKWEPGLLDGSVDPPLFRVLATR